MSAWPVNDNELHVLVHWISNVGLTKRNKTDIGRVLRAENWKSLRARYGYYSYPKAPSYHFSTPREGVQSWGGKPFDPFDPNTALKLVRFYDYQSCETFAYEGTQAWKWMRRLEKYLLTEGGATYPYEKVS